MWAHILAQTSTPPPLARHRQGPVVWPEQDPSWPAAHWKTCNAAQVHWLARIIDAVSWTRAPTSRNGQARAGHSRTLGPISFSLGKREWKTWPLLFLWLTTWPNYLPQIRACAKVRFLNNDFNLATPISTFLIFLPFASLFFVPRVCKKAKVWLICWPFVVSGQFGQLLAAQECAKYGHTSSVLSNGVAMSVSVIDRKLARLNLFSAVLSTRQSLSPARKHERRQSNEFQSQD